MDERKLSQLIKRYLDDSASDEEREELLIWYRSYDHEFIAWEGDEEEVDEILENVLGKIKSTVFQKEQKTLKVVRFPFYRSLVAAIALIALSLGSYFYYDNQLDSTKNIVVTNENNELLPGGNKATLTLADGSTIKLDESGREAVLSDKEVLAFEIGEGELIFNKDAIEDAHSTVFNTLTTPRGGQYAVQLPDGSKVWLNAESSLKFPASFSKSERRVTLIGEAYFDIVKNENQPFIVAMADMEVEVLGTQFNIKGYQDEAEILTTLVKGSVVVNKGGEHVLLKPGQLAKLNKKTGVIQTMATDMKAETAWRNGYFVFDNENIKSIMPQLAKWYDADIEYRGDMSDKEFTGSILKRSTIKEVLSILELTGTIKFQIEGRRIIVMP